MLAFVGLFCNAGARTSQQGEVAPWAGMASDWALGGVTGAVGMDGVLGRVPQSVVDEEDSGLQSTLEVSLELRGLGRVADNAQQQYMRSRPAPSPESIKRAKELDLAGLGLHPLFSKSPRWGSGRALQNQPQPQASRPARLALRGEGAAAAADGGQHQEVPRTGGEWARQRPHWAGTGSPQRGSLSAHHVPELLTEPQGLSEPAASDLCVALLCQHLWRHPLLCYHLCWSAAGSLCGNHFLPLMGG